MDSGDPIPAAVWKGSRNMSITSIGFSSLFIDYNSSDPLQEDIQDEAYQPSYYSALFCCCFTCSKVLPLTSVELKGALGLLSGTRLS